MGRAARIWSRRQRVGSRERIVTVFPPMGLNEDAVGTAVSCDSIQQLGSLQSRLFCDGRLVEADALWERTVTAPQGPLTRAGPAGPARIALALQVTASHDSERERTRRGLDEVL